MDGWRRGASHNQIVLDGPANPFIAIVYLYRKKLAFHPLTIRALSENLTKRPLLRNFLHPLNCEEPTLVTAIRLAMDERHRSGWFERDAEGVGLRLNWAGHGERLDE